MGTAAVRIPTHAIAQFEDPNIVKVVVNNQNYALYFSRSAIPNMQNVNIGNMFPLKHWGIYVFRKQFLNRFAQWSQSTLERLERLEQLRALENNAKIKVMVFNEETIGVDVPGDIKKVEAIIESKSKYFEI